MRTLEQARGWIDTGTSLVESVVAGLMDADLDAPSALDGWTRKALLAHLAANADALCNLVTWARTGVETPMYASTTQRNDDIAAGALRPADELRAWFSASAARLTEAMDGLSDAQWSATVVTAQGRSVPATEIPWLRTREVLIHAVDFGTGLDFTALPEDFILALIDDIRIKRSTGSGPALAVQADGGARWEITGDGEAVVVTGPVAQLAAYLAGRPFVDVITAEGEQPPTLGAWL